jgi:hypothetical protein
MGWQSNDTAAQKVMKAEKAVGNPIESVRISFSSGGDGIDNDKHSRANIKSDAVQKG